MGARLVAFGQHLGRERASAAAAYATARVPLWVRRLDGQPPEILVVDDDPDVATVLCELLVSAGYRVEVAHGGPEALLRLNSHTYDLVLADLMMPVLNGFELGRLVNVWDARPAMVAVTAYPVSAEGAARAGFDAYVRKPFDTDELLHLVERLTGWSQPPATPAAVAA